MVSPLGGSLFRNFNGLSRHTDTTPPIEPKRDFEAPSNHLAFPIVIAEWPRNSREIVRVALDRYHGHITVDCRSWYRDDAALKPGRSGITLAVKHLPALAEAMARALEAAADLGVLDDGGDR